MKRSSRIIFFGNERLSSGFDTHGAPTLEALLRNGYEVLAVVANFVPGASRTAKSLEIEQVAHAHNIPVLLPKKLTDIYDQLAGYGAEIGVLVAYGKIIPQSIIDIFPRGIINIHPSLLPQYRGSTPIEQAMLDGATKTGVSLMKLVQTMDAGPLYAQAEIALNGSETKQELTQTLLLKGGQLLLQALPSILDGSAHSWPQNETQATFTHLITKDMGVIDLRKSALQLEREVRAFALWPKSKLHIFGQSIIVLRTRVVTTATDGALVIACGHNSFLEILELIAPSGRRMNGADFMRGYKKTA